MIDDWVTVAGVAALIATSLCPFLPQACPAAVVTKAVQGYLERRKAERDAAPKPGAPTQVSVVVTEEHKV